MTSQLRFHHVLYACFAALLLTACNADTKSAEPVEQVDYYGNGKIQRRFWHVDGEKEGKMTDFYPDGKVKGERIFEDGKQVGRTTLYYPDGQVKEVQYYENGLKEGGDTLWYENRQPQFALQYKEGKRHGYLHKWSTDGKLIYEARFELDSLVQVKGTDVVKEGTTAPAPGN